MQLKEIVTNGQQGLITSENHAIDLTYIKLIIIAENN